MQKKKAIKKILSVVVAINQKNLKQNLKKLEKVILAMLELLKKKEAILL